MLMEAPWPSAILSGYGHQALPIPLERNFFLFLLSLQGTGTKLMTTLLHELERRRARYGLLTICEGGGTANAIIVERVDGNAKL